MSANFIDADAIPQEFRPYIGRPAQPPGTPEAAREGEVEVVRVAFNRTTNGVHVALPDGWGTGDWYRLLLHLLFEFGNQLVDAASAMELREQAREQSNG